MGAVERGVEGWNAAFGFEVFRARVATASESFGQDDKNYIIFDPDPSLGFAFANWRTNPNTGEIRGASVYFGGAWVDRFGFEDDPADGGSGGAPVRPATPTPKKMVGLRWAGVASSCASAGEITHSIGCMPGWMSQCAAVWTVVPVLGTSLGALRK